MLSSHKHLQTSRLGFASNGRLPPAPRLRVVLPHKTLRGNMVGTATFADSVTTIAEATYLSSGVTVAGTAESQAIAVFEPQMPNPSILASQMLVLALTIGAAGYWWLVVVPSERAALGRSKRMGPLDGYLRELEQPEAEKDRRLERWFYTDWLQQREERRTKRQQQQLQQNQVAPASREAVAGTGDSTATNPVPGGEPSGEDVYDSQQPYDENLLRPSAVTPTPRFLSLDNPIVATAAMLMVATAVAALQRGG